MLKINSATDSSYGADKITEQLHQKLTKLFDQELALALVTTGTAANCISLRAMVPGHGTILCANEAHLNNDEGQAPELLLGGAKLRSFSTKERKFDCEQARQWIKKAKSMIPHAGLPSAITITYASEWGDTYSSHELREIRTLCDDENLVLHIDGARLANALVAQNLSAAEFLKIARPDALSFGLTKNGALAAEAVVMFNRNYWQSLKFAQKQLAQLISKTRFMAVQFTSLLEKDLWLELARHANDCAQSLAKKLTQHPEVKLAVPLKTNQVFVHMPEAVAQKLQQQGLRFHPWEKDVWRFVCAWNTELDLSFKIN